MKAKHIKILRAKITEYNTYWIPLINKTFNVNVTYREVINDFTYMDFIFYWRIKITIQNATTFRH
jgi:hypothetical protein